MPDQIVVRSVEGRADLILRVINYVLPNGKIEKLVTNIFDESFTVDMFGELYELRWGIETCFKTLKSRLQIENFSSAKKLLILQDFYASVFVYNLMMAAIWEAVENAKPKDRKYIYKVNKNVAIGETRDLLIASLATNNSRRRGVLFRCACEVLLANVVFVRFGRCFECKGEA
ncbi:MAG: transposase [Candidatus Bathyarchaeota archaeon]|nr:transposase [Candidatus Termiticorpusculum sp.]